MKTLTAILFTIAIFGAHAKHKDGSHLHPTDQRSSPTFKDEKVGAAYTHYIHLKNALVASNASEAKNAAAELGAALQATSEIKAAQTAGDLAKAKSIEEQRMLFVVLSDEVTVLIKDSKLTSGVIYLQYCPMANNNEGAFWLSNDKEIKNPYFGEKMLKCGAVEETIQ
jgi:hypothetical protein